VAYEWRQGLPVLHGKTVTLREPRLSDAAAFYARLTTPAVARYISTPPNSPVGFERFIAWVQHERTLGRHACLALIPLGESEPVGLIQVRQLEAGFGGAEWGFAVAEDHWGTGFFMEAARATVDFAFRELRIHRLEARVSVQNHRGNGVMRKLGASHDGVLRQSFANAILQTDQVLWALSADEWLAAHPHPEYERTLPALQTPEVARIVRPPSAAPWRAGLPEVRGPRATLRELRDGDADTLAPLLGDPDVGRYIAAPPATVAGVRRFIQWTHDQRASGSVICFAIVPNGLDSAVGVFQIHEREAPFHTAEWGFVIGRPYWGSGLFEAGAALLLQFAFETLGVWRLEARALAENVRANAVLRRLGATDEGHLSRSFLLGGRYHDDVLWSMLATDWRQRHP
jgi:[ribosomal protein S5]-alanine N-acetyltransferase